MSKFVRRPKARPDDILESALDHFLRRGFSDVTMAEIAASAGITAGSIYRYFDSKDALVAALVERHLETRWARGPELAEAYRSMTAREVLTLLLHRWVQYLEQGPAAGVLILVLREAPRFPDTVAKYTTQLLSIGCTALERALRHGIEREEFAPNLEIQATAQALAASVLDQIVWRNTFGAHLPRLPAGVEPYKLAIDALTRGLPKAGELLQPPPPPSAALAELKVDRQPGLRITTLRPPTDRP